MNQDTNSPFAPVYYRITYEQNIKFHPSNEYVGINNEYPSSF